MKVRIDRDSLVKSKGEVPVPKAISDIQLSDKQVKQLTEILVESIANHESPSGLFFKKGEENEAT